MNCEIKAIETVYKGYRFRSRLEARWAVFFDALGLKWSYEVEGFQLPSGWYLPDFWIDYECAEPGWGFFIEIKPRSLSEDESRLLAELAEHSGHRCYSLAGNTWPGEYKCSVFQHHRNGIPCKIPAVVGTIYTMKSVFNTSFDDGGSGYVHEYHEDCPCLIVGERGEDTRREDDEWGMPDQSPMLRPTLPFPMPANFHCRGHNLLSKAFTAARQARFEHGETP